MKMLKAILAILLAGCLLASCGDDAGETASVQAVSMIATFEGSGLGLRNRFAGMVSARKEVTIEKDENREIAEVLVSEGETVYEGQVLFTYDSEQAELLIEKAQLELEQMKADITAKRNNRNQLEKDKKKAGKDEQLAYTLEIQACDAAIREGEYNLKLKQKEVERLKESTGTKDVVSPVDGQITAMNVSGDAYDSMGQKKPFITMMESGAHRVRGIFNENNAGQIMEGVPVRILSRVDDSVWTGVISQIDWEHPVSNGNGGGYATPVMGVAVEEEGGGLTTSSSYPFYVELDDSEGLRLGQHVYVEMASGGANHNPDALYVPSCYFVDFNEDGAFVWAQNSKGKLEKRAVTLGAYEEETDCYEVTSGLDLRDYIAFPDENLKEGMRCVVFDENAFDMGGDDMDTGFDNGMMDDADNGMVSFDDMGEAMIPEDLPDDDMEAGQDVVWNGANVG